MKEQRCQHVGCGQLSHTGFWCQRCIEQEWPCAALGDGQHWIAWKGVERAGRRDDLFRGAMDCPYRIGRFAHPQGNSNWLLSPLGAIKEGYGSHILAAIVSAPRCWLRQDLILDSTSPVLPLTAFPRSLLPTQQQAGRLLDAVNLHLAKIEAFEQQMRRRLPLGSTLGSIGLTLKAHTLRLQLCRTMMSKAARYQKTTKSLRRQLLDATRQHLPQWLASSEPLLSHDERLIQCISQLRALLSTAEQQRWMYSWLMKDRLNPQYIHSHEQLLLNWLQDFDPTQTYQLLSHLIRRSELIYWSHGMQLLFERLLLQVPAFDHEQKAGIAAILLQHPPPPTSEFWQRLTERLLGEQAILHMRQVRQKLETRSYVTLGPWLLSQSGVLYWVVLGGLECWRGLQLQAPSLRLPSFYLMLKYGMVSTPCFERESFEVAVDLLLCEEPESVREAVERRSIASAGLD